MGRSVKCRWGVGQKKFIALREKKRSAGTNRGNCGEGEKPWWVKCEERALVLRGAQEREKTNDYQRKKNRGQKEN